MRVGMMLAAAAALVFGAGQAEAVTFLKYEVTGDGYLSSPFSLTPNQQTYVKFAYDFIVEVDPGYSDTSHLATGTGSSFSYEGPPHDVYASITGPNELRFTETPVVQGAIPTSFTVDYDGASDPTLFPTFLNTGAASGDITINRAGKFSGYLVFGSISGLQILGTTSAFDYPTFSYSLPEPATWAMMIAGFGAIGAIARRRSRRAAVQFAG